MADGSAISWTDATWNPVRGCSRVSEGCRHCYAEQVAGRFSGPGQAYEGLAERRLKVIDDDTARMEGRWTGQVRLVPEHLDDPIRWRRPRRIFVNSMSDLFHERLTNEEIAAVFGVMAAASQHTFQVLTKRAARMRAWFEWARGEFTERQRAIASAPNTVRAMLDASAEYLGLKHSVLNKVWRSDSADADFWPLPNVQLGVSVEHQAAADDRIPLLLKTPAALRFLSCEPLLGDVRLEDGVRSWLRGPDAIGWVIAGCESGHGARPADVRWFRHLRDQCRRDRVPFFLKQAAYVCGGDSGSGEDDPIAAGDRSKVKARWVIELPYLDGVQHAAFPEARAS